MAQTLYLMNDNEWCIVWSFKYRGVLLLTKTVPDVEYSNFGEIERLAL